MTADKPRILRLPCSAECLGAGPSARNVVVTRRSVVELRGGAMLDRVIATGSTTAKGSGAPVTAVRCVPGLAGFVATGDARGEVCLWRAKADRLHPVSAATNDDAAFIRALLVTGTAARGFVWSGGTSSTITQRLRSHMTVHALHELDKHDTAHAILDAGRAGVVVVSDAAVTLFGPKTKRVLANPKVSLCAGAITSNGRVVVTGDIDGGVAAFDLKAATTLWVSSAPKPIDDPAAHDDHPLDEITSIAIDSDDRRVAIASTSGLRILDVATGKQAFHREAGDNEKAPRHIVWRGAALIVA